MKPQRIAIFGGSFDPVHVGHLDVAEAALCRHKLDLVFFVPARLQPHKPTEPHASGEQRLEMISLAIRTNPQFAVSDCEIRRPGKSFTVDTIREFRAALGPDAALFLIIGSDSLRDFSRWHGVNELASLCEIIVAARPNEPLSNIDALSECLAPEQIESMKRLSITATANPTSATEIRRRRTQGEKITELVPAAVEDYVARNNLYV